MARPFDPHKLPRAVWRAAVLLDAAVHRRARAVDKTLWGHGEKDLGKGFRWTMSHRDGKWQKLWTPDRFRSFDPETKTWKDGKGCVDLSGLRNTVKHNKVKGGPTLKGFLFRTNVHLEVHLANWDEYRKVRKELEELGNVLRKADKVLYDVRNEVKKSLPPHSSWKAVASDPRVVEAEVKRKEVDKAVTKASRPVVNAILKKLKPVLELLHPDDLIDRISDDGVLVLANKKLVIPKQFLGHDCPVHFHSGVKGFEAKKVDFEMDWRPEIVIPEDYYAL